MENFKKVTKELCDLGEAFDQALEDKKISWVEWIKIAKEGFDVASPTFL